MHNKLKQFIRFSKYLLPYWDKSVLIIIVSVSSMLFGMISPLLTKATIDYAYTNRDIYLFNILVISGLILFIFSSLTGFIQEYLNFYINLKVDFDLRRKLYKHLQKLSLRFFQSRSTGEQMYRLDYDVRDVTSLVVDILPTVITSSVQLIFLLIICSWLNWKATLAVIVLTPLFYLHPYYFAKREATSARKLKKQGQSISKGLQEAISQIKLVKIFGREKSEIKRYIKNLITQIRLTIQNHKLSMFSSNSGALLNTVILTGISYCIGYQVIKRNLTLGSMMALTIYLFQLIGQLRSIGGIYESTMVKFVSVDRFLETFDAEVEIEDAKDAISLPIKGGIEFKKVTFGYSPNKPVLKDMGFKIETGETVGLVGYSGAGKTTIVNLLPRLYDPQSGVILIDGRDIRKLKMDSLREQIGVVPQESLISEGTIEEVIKFGKPQATLGEVKNAAKIADASEFILKLQDGYDTQVGEKGCNLSEGQRQRIAIARAVIKNPKILILDEAVSSIDSLSETHIKEALKDRKITTIIITHRLSTLIGCDNIFVLDKGKILEEGNHAELLKNSNGLYRQLFTKQFEDMHGKEKETF